MLHYISRSVIALFQGRRPHYNMVAAVEAPFLAFPFICERFYVEGLVIFDLFRCNALGTCNFVVRVRKGVRVTKKGRGKIRNWCSHAAGTVRPVLRTGVFSK